MRLLFEGSFFSRAAFIGEFTVYRVRRVTQNYLLTNINRSTQVTNEVDNILPSWALDVRKWHILISTSKCC